jgi:ubiquinone biosynthesis protein COQ4
MLAQIAKRQFQQISALQSGLALVRNPNNLREVINLSDKLLGMAGSEDIRKFSEELCKSPQAIDAVEKRYRVHSSDLKRLAKCKKGTLGYAYIQHLEKNEITPESLTPPPVKDDFSYVVAHLYETHDIWHTVTGYGTSVADELGLAAFGAAQLPSQFEYLLIAGGILNTVFYEFHERDERMSAIAEGWVLGKKAKPLFGVKWNELWNKKLVDVRQTLGL